MAARDAAIKRDPSACDIARMVAGAGSPGAAARKIGPSRPAAPGLARRGPFHHAASAGASRATASTIDFAT